MEKAQEKRVEGYSKGMNQGSGAESTISHSKKRRMEQTTTRPSKEFGGWVEWFGPELKTRSSSSLPGIEALTIFTAKFPREKQERKRVWTGPRQRNYRRSWPSH